MASSLARSLILSLLVLATMLAGCYHKDSGGGSGQTYAAPAGPGQGALTPGPDGSTVAITDYTKRVNRTEPMGAPGTGGSKENETPEPSDPIHVTWNIDGSAAGPVPTELRWGNRSVSTVNSAASYPNLVAEYTADALPRSFAASFQVNHTGSIFLRARAVVAGADVWSQEAQVVIAPKVPPQTYTLFVGRTTIGPLAAYAPKNVSIVAGDSVVWDNKDPIFAHTATSQAGAPDTFDTGQIATGQTSAAITFATPGEYTYGCTVHPTMEPGTIHVAPRPSF